MTLSAKRVAIPVLVGFVMMVSLAANGRSPQQPPTDQGAAPARPPASEWLQLFNGKDLDGWVPKIAGFDLGVNYNDTFRVENGFLEASYDKYKTFDNHFGHCSTAGSSPTTSWRPSTGSSVSRHRARLRGRCATTG